MVKNKAFPDSASCTPRLVTHSLSLFHSLSLADLALSRLVSRIFSLSRRRHSSWGYPLDPAEAGPRQIANGNFLYESGNSNLGSVTFSRGGMWEVRRKFKREGTYVYLRLIHVDEWQKPTQYCKATIPQLKINKCFKNAKKDHNLDVMVLGGADYGRCLGHEGSQD